MSISTNEGMMLLEREEKIHIDCVSIIPLAVFYHYLAEITFRKMGINSISRAHEI